MKYQEQHEAFKMLLIQQGICKMEQLTQALPFGCSVPSKLIDRWLNRMLRLPKEFSSQRRYVNRFKLGADPEFVFMKQGERRNANSFRLQQGLAFGMDNNGRLTEIRPEPSRSALEVAASILATLRWLATLIPKTLEYDWIAGAFIEGDGLGGHVHLGRKRPGRHFEVKALDAIDDELLAINAYPLKEVQRRRAGDAHHQFYGMPSDIRQQLHGYEYRTFPSWLDSPELAFLTLTLSKLVVQNPKLAQGYIPLPSLDRHFQRIRNILAFYKDLDDDARLAFNMVSRDFPVHLGGDFKVRWGIGAFPAQSVQFIPASIKPSDDDIKELFEHFMGIRPLHANAPILTWSPPNPPPDYVMAICMTDTLGAKGLGELIWDVCQHRNLNCAITNAREVNWFFSIPEELMRGRSLPPGGVIKTHSGETHRIYSSETHRKTRFTECRRLLLETVMPYWQIGKVKPDSWQQWQKAKKKTRKEMYAGELLWGDLSQLPIVG